MPNYLGEDTRKQSDANQLNFLCTLKVLVGKNKTRHNLHSLNLEMITTNNLIELYVGIYFVKKIKANGNGNNLINFGWNNVFTNWIIFCFCFISSFSFPSFWSYIGLIIRLFKLNFTRKKLYRFHRAYNNIIRLRVAKTYISYIYLWHIYKYSLKHIII